MSQDEVMVEEKLKRKAKIKNHMEDEVLPSLPTFGLELSSYTSEQLAMMPVDFNFDANEKPKIHSPVSHVANEDRRKNKRQKQSEIQIERIITKVPNIEKKIVVPKTQIIIKEDELMPLSLTGLELSSYTSEQLAMMPLEE